MKLIFGLIIGVAILAIVIALYCTFVIAGRYDAKDDNVNSDEEKMT